MTQPESNRNVDVTDAGTVNPANVVALRQVIDALYEKHECTPEDTPCSECIMNIENVREVSSFEPIRNKCALLLLSCIVEHLESVTKTAETPQFNIVHKDNVRTVNPAGYNMYKQGA